MSERPGMLLTLSAIGYFVGAVALVFAPQETAAALGASAGPGQAVLLQVVGSALLGFAMLNWSSRHSRLGGIYGRPLLLANLAFTMTAGLNLLRPTLSDLGRLALTLPTVALLLLAIVFATRLFARPA